METFVGLFGGLYVAAGVVTAGLLLVAAAFCIIAAVGDSWDRNAARDFVPGLLLFALVAATWPVSIPALIFIGARKAFHKPS